MSLKINETMGRPASWPEPTTDIARRLQNVLPKYGKGKIAKLFFGNLSEVGVKSILEGKTEPPPSALKRISDELDIDLDWLAWGKQIDRIKNPPAEASGEFGGTTRDLVNQCLLVQELLARVTRLLSGDKGVNLEPKSIEECSEHIRALANHLADVAKKEQDRRRA